MKTIGIAIKLFHTPARIAHEAIPINPGARNMFVHFPLEENQFDKIFPAIISVFFKAFNVD